MLCQTVDSGVCETCLYVNFFVQIKLKMERDFPVFKRSLPLINKTGFRAVTSLSMCTVMVCFRAHTFTTGGTRAGQLVLRAFACLCAKEREMGALCTMCETGGADGPQQTGEGLGDRVKNDFGQKARWLAD